MTVNFSSYERYLPKPFRGSSHTWARSQLSNLPDHLKVLDIGPGSGVIAAELKERGFKNLYAVEIDAQTRERVKDLYISVHPNLNDFQEQKFDIILLLDLLEHLPNPEKFFSDCVSHLEDNGIILVSVPNIAHWSIRLSLLFGFFNYSERGILDRTHLQFFTKKRVKNLMKYPGLSVINQQVTIAPYELLLPRFLWNNPIYDTATKIRHILANTFPGLLGYQFVCCMKKPG